MRYCPACHRCFHDGVEFCLFDQSATREGAGLPLVIEGKYQLERLIAHGGMGSVYRAMHLQLERPVAVKILRPEYLADAKVRERFHREALAAARLKHPNIISIYDFGSLAQGSAYIVMELVEGRSLRDELRSLAVVHGVQGRMLRPERAAAIMQQVCAGVEAAHRSGIIHRDLKPDNIMIETPALEPEGSERILVLDFGIAKLKQAEGVVQCLTDEEMIIGTPNYISPEQCTGLPADARSDVYALGVILYEMLTGQVPFSNNSTAAVLLSHLQESPAPPTRFRMDLHPAVEGVVLRALAKSPAHRFASAAQLAESFTKAVLLGERAMPEALPELELLDEATRPRLGRVVLPASASVANAPIVKAEVDRTETAAPVRTEPFEPPFEKTAPALVFNSPTPVPLEREPNLYVERRPRRGLFVVIAAVSLLGIGALADFNSGMLQGRLSRLVQALNPAAAQMSTPASVSTETMTVAEAATPVVPQTSSVDPAATPLVPETEAVSAAAPTPTALVKATAEENAATAKVLRDQVKTFYRRWAETALNTQWQEHAKYYAGQVAYYNEGALARGQVVARKRRVFGGLDKYYLRFAGEPQISFTQGAAGPEAQLTFDKQWDLQRGKERTAGKALTQIVLRQDAKQDWQIVSEKQVKLYHQSASVTRKEPAKAVAKPKPVAVRTAKQAGRKPVKPAVKLAAQRGKTRQR